MSPAFVRSRIKRWEILRLPFNAVCVASAWLAWGVSNDFAVAIDEGPPADLGDPGALWDLVLGFAVLNIAYSLVYAVEFAIAARASQSWSRSVKIALYCAGCSVGFFVAGRGASGIAKGIASEKRYEMIRQENSRGLRGAPRMPAPPVKKETAQGPEPDFVQRRDAIYFTLPKPAPGRAQHARGTDVVATPEKYNGQRVILAGIYTGGFENSSFELDEAKSTFYIWVDFDWKKIDEPLGDLSDRKRKWANGGGHVRNHIVAEGTFYYRAEVHPAGIGGPAGFGHFGVANGCFLVDRLLEYDPLSPEEGKKAPQSTLNTPR